MNFEGKFKTMTKEQIVRFLKLNSMKKLEKERIIRFLQERYAKD